MAATIEKQEATTAAPEPLDEGPRYTPLVDIVETNDGYTFYADLPGVKAGDLDITYEDDTSPSKRRWRRASRRTSST